MPLWQDKSVWELFLEGYCEFVRRDFSESINEHPNDSEKKLINAIRERISIINEKEKTDGKTNLKTETTEALIANENKGKKSLLPGKSRLKKQNNGGEKADSRDDELAQGNGNEHVQ